MKADTFKGEQKDCSAREGLVRFKNTTSHKESASLLISQSYCWQPVKDDVAEHKEKALFGST